MCIVQAKAQARQQAKEGEKLGKAVEARDSRIAVLVQEKQRLSEEAEKHISQAGLPHALTIHVQMI